MNVTSDKDLKDAIINVKKYLLGKIQEDMGDIPMSKLKKSKMVIVEGGDGDLPEEMSEMDDIKSMLSGKGSCESESYDDYEDEEEMEDPDVKRIKAQIKVKKGAK